VEHPSEVKSSTSSGVRVFVIDVGSDACINSATPSERTATVEKSNVFICIYWMHEQRKRSIDSLTYEGTKLLLL